MMHHIRPYQILTLASGNVTLPIPSKRSAESKSPSLLETFLLIAAARLVKAQRIFEFGTCLGVTAKNLALNSPAEIVTFDMNEFKGRRSLGVTYLNGDSRTADFSSYTASMDFVFVDGGDDRETVEADGENAFRMIGSRKGCIAWHSYEPKYPEIKGWLDHKAESTDLYHVEDSLLCFWFAGGLPK